MDEAEVQRRMYRAPTPREREPRRAIWLLVQGWTPAAVGRALDRDAHTIKHSICQRDNQVRISERARPAYSGTRLSPEPPRQSVTICLKLRFRDPDAQRIPHTDNHD